MTDHTSVFLRPAPWVPSDLFEATRLSLTATASSPRATAAADHIAGLVAAEEQASGRKNIRRAAGQAKLASAVVAILGGLLRPWGRPKPRWTYRPVGRSEFSGESVAARQFQAVITALRSKGLIEVVPGFATPIDFDGTGEFSRFGRATRFRPTADLLTLVEGHGITPQTLGEDFIDTFPKDPPSVPDLVILRPLAVPRRKGSSKPFVASIKLDANDVEVKHFRSEVSSLNNFAARFDVQGCRPPRWYRTFTEDFEHGGRWIAAGNEGNYQRLPQYQRLLITIDGADVVSLDISASHLSIMLGLAGQELPPGDPYDVGGISRHVIKHLAVVTAGKGVLPKRWPQDTAPEVAQVPIEEAGAALVAAYPFMREPWTLLSTEGEAKVAKRLFVHRLMAIEASALSYAMLQLVEKGILALPVHDELIVRSDAAALGREALAKAFRTVAKIDPRIKETKKSGLEVE
jgi:hypothetical protein